MFDMTENKTSHDNTFDSIHRLTTPKLCGMGVLSLYMTTWNSSGVLVRKQTRYRKRTISLAIIWRNAHRDKCSLLDKRLLLRKEKPE